MFSYPRKSAQNYEIIPIFASESINNPIFIYMKINLFFATALVSLLAVSCASTSEKTELFNGKDLSGWVCYADPSSEVPVSDVYSVADEVIHVAGKPFGYMRTEKKYGDCTVHVEWRWVGEGTNSGIFVHVQDGDKLWPNAIECQLCSGKAGDFVMLGGSKIQEVECVAEYPVKDRNGNYEKPVGEWNTAEIISEGNKITVYINGELQNECTCDSTEGYIALQSEGGPLEFRNIYVTEF